MIRICKMSGKYYGYDMTGDDDESIIKQIEGFVNEGTPVLIIHNEKDIEDFFPQEWEDANVIMVERDQKETK